MDVSTTPCGEADRPDEAVWPEFARHPRRRLRVLLVDDHAVVRAGVAALLSIESDLEIVGDAGCLREAIPMARELAPDLVVCDLTMPGCAGCEAVRQLHHEFPAVRVMVLSAHGSLESVHESFCAGATGYVHKDALRADLLAVLRRVAAGRSAICPVVGEMMIREWLQAPCPKPAAAAEVALDADERQVLRLIALGVPTRRIAAGLGRGVKAVEKYRTTLMRRLNLHSTAAIAQFAVQCQLLTMREVDQLVSAD
jgi:DNA-binding NarL/FixJ family response regulator